MPPFPLVLIWLNYLRAPTLFMIVVIKQAEARNALQDVSQDAAWYYDLSRGLVWPAAYVMLRGVDEVETLLAALEADAVAALKYDALAEERRQRVRVNLPEARKLNVGPAELERRIHQLFTATTISRWTADVAPPETVRRGRRKRPGAGPGA
jgi:hypothetical protein